ncbi:MAG: hypothetical protein Q4G10_01930 [Bacteroidia bacterium]|nr:hypothetical protein [Bacteroidia bacterium]
MHRTLLFFITSIFLCAAVSTRAQDLREWELKAVELERIVYASDDPFEVNDALVEKAFCYKQSRRFADAASTLGRVRMYMLSPEKQREVIYEKELCSYLAGDFEAAAAYIEEADASGAEAGPERMLLDALVYGECGRWDDAQDRAEAFVRCLYEGEELESALAQIEKQFSETPDLKSTSKVLALAFLPPLGHWYTGHYGEGALSMLLNAAAAGWCVWQCLEGCWISGLLGGGIALNYTFMGNQERSAWLVEKYNHDAVRQFNDSLKEMLLSHSGAE